MRAARLLAQGKINLFLRVLARETSGYHSLETLFQRLELADDVVVRVDVSGRSLECGGADLGAVEQNLAWRAASLFHDRTGWPAGFAIEIHKRIPVGAGLGGGSADAGAVLRILNRLAPAPAEASTLLDMALAIGADVPFLASEYSLALAWGRGERLLGLPPLSRRGVLLRVGECAVGTAEAFGWLAAAKGAYEPRARALQPHQLSSWKEVEALAENDFEEVVAARHPDIRSALDNGIEYSGPAAGGGDPGILSGTRPAMTGSGSALFTLLDGDAPPAGASAAGNANEKSGMSSVPRIILTATAGQVVAVEEIE